MVQGRSDFAPIRGNYGQTNSDEDWGSMWEQYFFDPTNAPGEVAEKITLLDSFFTAMENV